MEEFYNFYVKKPTYTSKMNRKLGVEDFPNIIICPEPSIDTEAAKSNGYKSVKMYFLGLNQENKTVVDHQVVYDGPIGWAGNNSQGVKKVHDEISNLKTTKDCPDGDNYFWYRDNETFQYPNVQFELTKALYPNHVCCMVVIPKFSEVFPLSGMKISSRNRTFKLFMADQVTASYFDQQKTIMLGDKIISGDNGITNYKIKLLEEIAVEGDPQNHCIDYKVKGEY